MTTLLLAGAENGSVGADGDISLGATYTVAGTPRATTGTVVVQGSASFKAPASGTATMEFRLDGNHTGSLYVEYAAMRPTNAEDVRFEFHGDSGLAFSLGFVGDYPAAFNSGDVVVNTAVSPVRAAVAGEFYVTQARIDIGVASQIWGNGRYDLDGITLLSAPVGASPGTGPINRIRVVFADGALIDDIYVSDSAFGEGLVIGGISASAASDTDIGTVAGDIARGTGTVAYGSTTTDASDQKSTWSFTGFDALAATFGPIKITALCAKSGYDEIECTQVQGATTVTGVPRFVSTTYRFIDTIFDQDANLAAWDAAKLASGRFGVTVKQPTSTV